MSPPRAADEPTRLDARGLRCPMPVIRLARLARRLDPGDVVLVLADDPAARADIPAWGRMKGHAVRLEDRGDHTAYEVVVGEATSRS